MNARAESTKYNQIYTRTMMIYDVFCVSSVLIHTAESARAEKFRLFVQYDLCAYFIYTSI